MRPQAVEAGVFVPLPLAGAVHQLLAYGLDELRRRDGVRPHAVVVELVEMFGAARRAVEEASAADVPPVDVTPYRRRTMACSGSPGRCSSGSHPWTADRFDLQSPGTSTRDQTCNAHWISAPTSRRSVERRSPTIISRGWYRRIPRRRCASCQ